MPKYTYVVEHNGKAETETMDARDKYAVFQHVRETGGRLITIAEDGQSLFAKIKAAAEQVATVSGYDIITFARTLSAMLVAGLPLSRALGISVRQVSNPRFKKIIEAVADRIKSGKTFSDALAEHTIFSPLFLAMVRAGEESGSLPNALSLIADQLERGYKLKKQIRGAMMYPGVVIVAMIGVAYLMLTQIMPTMIQTFESQKIALPATTQALVTASNFLTQHTVLFFTSLIIVVAGLISLAKTQRGKWVIHRILIYAPVVGPMVVEVNAARGARTLASLVSSGVDMVKALGITKDVLVNSAFREIMIAAEDAVVKGSPLSSVFVDKHTVYPQLFGEMIAVGEETGDMPTMLNRLATYYENELEQKMKNINGILEPLLMLFIGGTVGFFAMAIIAPIYSLGDSV